MRFPKDVEERLAEILVAPLETTLATRTVAEPWDEATERALRPIHFALVPAAVWKGSKFERSFVTSLGNMWEKAAVEASRGLSKWMKQAFDYQGTIYSRQLDVITRILDDLDAGRRQPDWDLEVEEVFAAASGPKETSTVRADVAIGDSESHRASHEYFEIKSPLPNKDQTKVSKTKMLKLTAMEGRECAYFALPFNPFESRAAYKHTHPKRYFNMHDDRVVLIGVEFWERLGGKGTWDALVDIAERVGKDYHTKVEAYLLGDKPA